MDLRLTTIMKTPPERSIRIIMKLNNADIVDMCISKNIIAAVRHRT